jgi:hypothetical protein
MREITFVKKLTHLCDLFLFLLFPTKIRSTERLIPSRRFIGLSNPTLETQNYVHEFFCRCHKANCNIVYYMTQSSS